MNSKLLMKVLEHSETVKEAIEDVRNYQTRIESLLYHMKLTEQTIERLKAERDGIISSLAELLNADVEEVRVLVGLTIESKEKKVRKQRTNGLRDKIMEYFSTRKGTWVRARTIAEKLEANEGAVLRALNQLTQEGVLKREKQGRHYLFALVE